MATESVATNSVPLEDRKAITTLISDSEWEGLEPHLPIGVFRRLAKVDRALFAATQIAEMLQADNLGRQDQMDNPGVEFHGLGLVDREALELGMIELLRAAQGTLEEVRSNKYGCVSGHRQRN